MKVIFLDIDGVLNSQLLWEKTHRRRWFTLEFYYYWIRGKIRFALNGFKSKAYSLTDLMNSRPLRFKDKFKRFKKQTDKFALKLLADLLWSTNSKLCISSVWRDYFTIKEWNTVFSMLGVGENVVVGVTGWRKHCRGQEIQAWLEEHHNVVKFIIVDDDSDMLKGQLPHFFQTDGYCGLSPNICYRIKKHLNEDEPQVK